LEKSGFLIQTDRFVISNCDDIKINYSTLAIAELCRIAHPVAPGDHLPQHTTFDLSLGKDFGERLSASLHALNVANRRVDLDNSQTFGGFHWNNPREIYAEFRYRFHY
jgi:hypothetical protein